MEQNTNKKVITIIVNGREKETDLKRISYQEVIEMAFNEFINNPDVVYTVTYSNAHGNSKGSLVQGDTIKVKQGMVFNVSRTDRS